MAINLITAVPGAGKTLLAMSKIEKATKEGRLVFSDIDGITLPGVVVVGPDHDWRDTPDGSLIVYDEVHKRFPTTGKSGLASDVKITAMDEHRHTGHDFIMMTQFPTKLHHEVRSYCDEHEHLQRIMGSQSATVYTWPYAIYNPNDRKEREGADSRVFAYPKRLYKYYKSSTHHSNKYKFKLPNKLKFAVVILVLAVVGIGQRLTSGDSMLANAVTGTAAPVGAVVRDGGAGEIPAPLPTVFTSTLNDWTSTPVLPAVMGCVSSETKCHCYGENGQLLNLKYEVCLDAMERPLPLKLNESSKRRQS